MSEEDLKAMETESEITLINLNDNEILSSILERKSKYLLFEFSSL